MGGNATTTATGTSGERDTVAAATEAIRRAIVRLRGAPPTQVLVFASAWHDLRTALVTARRLTGLDAIGCSTAGEITELGATTGSLAVMLLSSPALTRTALAEGLGAGPAQVAAELARGLGESKQLAAQSGQRSVTTVLLTDGLAGTGEKLVTALYDSRVQASSQIVGGAAADDGRFRATFVGAGEHVARDAAVAMHFFSERPWGVGVNHGLVPTTGQMRVTSAVDNVVYELDGQPAFSVYQRHAAERGIHLTREGAGPYLVANELGIHFFENVTRARAPLSVRDDGSLVCAGDIPPGAMVSILNGEPTGMIAAARAAAEEARAKLNGAPVAGVLLFDCVCRGMILGPLFGREVEAVRAVFGEVPIAGFLTYGEIARTADKLDGWHNTSAVVVAIPR